MSIIKALFLSILLLTCLSCKSLALKRSNKLNCILTYQINLGDSLERVKNQNTFDLKESSGGEQYDYYKMTWEFPQNDDPFILRLSTIHTLGSLIKIKFKKKEVSRIKIIWLTDEFDIASPERLKKFLYQVSSRHFDCLDQFQIPEFVPLDRPYTYRISQDHFFEELSVFSMGPYNAVSYEIKVIE